MGAFTVFQINMLDLLSEFGSVPIEDLPYIYSSYNEYLYFRMLGYKIKDNILVALIQKISGFSELMVQEIRQIFDLRFTIRRPPRYLETDLALSKISWPVPILNEMFLPEFQVKKAQLEHKFKIIGHIARGSFGRVYKIMERNTSKIYAVKLLQKSQVICENAVDQVKDEVRIHRACGHHEFIVNFLFSWQTHSLLVIVIEFKNGGDMYQFLEKYSSLPEEVVKLFVAEISIAIDFLHSAGVIYRDLKPENILLDENSHIYLTDFGLSKWLSSGSRTNTICGTLQYTAPEIQQGKPYSHSSDWWSLGVLTCRLLTNQYPVVTDNIFLPNDMNLSVAAKDLLLRLLTLDPLKRLRSLYTLKTIAFFKNYDFGCVLKKKISPAQLLRECKTNENVLDKSHLFADFDEDEGTREALQDASPILSMTENLKSNIATSV